MFTEKINNLKKKINDFQNAGGNIYATKKQLPYYEYMHTLKRRMEEHFKINLTMEYMYSLCGVRFDRDYNDFKVLCDRLSKFADKNGCVDIIRTKEMKEKDTVYSDLRIMANKYNANLIDFLLFMTPYYFSSGRVSGDNIAKIKRDLLAVYPKRNINGIRRDNPKLYERIRSLQFAFPEKISMQELIQFLGFENDRFSTLQKRFNVNEKEVLVELQSTFPNKNASGITNVATGLYHKIVRLSIMNDQSVEQWLESKGYIYPTSNAGTRLSATEVSYEDRKKEVLPLKKKYEKRLKKENADEIDNFYFALNVMKMATGELEKSMDEYLSV